MKFYIIEAYYLRKTGTCGVEIYNKQMYGTLKKAKTVAETYVHGKWGNYFYNYLIYEIDTDEGIAYPVDGNDWRKEFIEQNLQNKNG